MDDSSGAKEDENVMHKVGIRLGKRPISEEKIMLMKSRPTKHLRLMRLPLEVVVVAAKFDFRIEFTTDMRVKQHADMLK
jgi:hypothetical protein